MKKMLMIFAGVLMTASFVAAQAGMNCCCGCCSNNKPPAIAQMDRSCCGADCCE